MASDDSNRNSFEDWLDSKRDKPWFWAILLVDGLLLGAILLVAIWMIVSHRFNEEPQRAARSVAIGEQQSVMTTRDAPLHLALFQDG